MKISECVDALESPGWEQISVDANSLDRWIAIARAIRGAKACDRPAQLIARIQVILVRAGLIDDEAFVARLQAD